MTARRDEPVFFVGVKPKAVTTGGGAPSAALLAARKATLEKEIADIEAKGPPTKEQFEKITKNKATIAAIEKQLASKAPAAPPPVTVVQPPVEDITNSVLSFEFEESEKKNDLLKLTLDNSDLRWFDSPAIEHGVVYLVMWGYVGNLVPAREVIVQKVHGDLTLNVECAGKGLLMHKQAKTRVFTNVTRAEVVRRVAEENGYGPEVQFVDDGPPVATTGPNRVNALLSKIAEAKAFLAKALDAGPPTKEQFDKIAAAKKTIADAEAALPAERKLAASEPKPAGVVTRYAAINQAAMTDAQFLKRLADLQGFEFYVDHTGLHWHPRKVGAKPKLELTYFLPPDVGDIISFNVENDITAKPASVAVKGIDPLTKKEIGSTADDGTPRPTLAGTPDLPSDAKVVDPVTGETKMVAGGAAAPAASVATTSEPNAAAAKAEAAGQVVRNQQSMFKLKVSIVGNPRVTAKSVIMVTGLGKRLSGRYYVAEVHHKLGQGFTQELVLRSDGTNVAGGAKAAAAADSAADPNTKTPDGSSGALTPKKVVDPITGETSTIFTTGG